MAHLKLCVIPSLFLFVLGAFVAPAGQPVDPSSLGIVRLDPPEKGFFSKQLDFHGIPIKAHAVVVDEALFAAYNRLNLLLTNLLVGQPLVLSNLLAAGV